MHRILIIEDELKVASFIAQGLREEGYDTLVANDGNSGVRMALEEKVDLVILDVNLPGMTGFAVCKTIRKQKEDLPVLMLTALGATENKVEGLEGGADDYMVKPFEFVELTARVKALLRRSYGNPHVLKLADLELNLDSKYAKRGGKIIELTAKEFALLEYLMKNKGRTVSRTDIAEKIWDITFDTGTNVIDVYINFLRKKIDKDFSPKLIHTQVGMGYVMKEGAE